MLTSLSHLKENPECYVFISDWKRLRALSARSFSALWLDTPEKWNNALSFGYKCESFLHAEKAAGPNARQIFCATKDSCRDEEWSKCRIPFKSFYERWCGQHFYHLVSRCRTHSWLALLSHSLFCSTGCQVDKTWQHLMTNHCFGQGSGAIHAVCFAAMHFKIFSQANNNKKTLSKAKFGSLCKC